MNDLYLSPAALICFDDTPPDEEKVTFTPEQQKKVNELIAETKRKQRADNQRVEQQLRETLETAKLSEEQRSRLEATLEEVQTSLRTKEEQAAHEKKQLETQHQKKLAELEKRAVTAEQRYTESTITSALHQAANGGDAFNSEIVTTVLRPMTRIIDDKVVVDYPDVDDDDQPVVRQLSPTEAVTRMREQPAKFGGLFKNNIVSGIGGTSSVVGTPTGKVDVRKLTAEQYMKLRKENPEALGLSRS